MGADNIEPKNESWAVVVELNLDVLTGWYRYPHSGDLHGHLEPARGWAWSVIGAFHPMMTVCKGVCQSKRKGGKAETVSRGQRT